MDQVLKALINNNLTIDPAKKQICMDETELLRVTPKITCLKKNQSFVMSKINE